MLVTENQLDEWVRAHAREAQGVIVELVWRLVAAAVPKPRDRRFPLGDSIEQHGPDGVLDTQIGLDPFVPEGRSLWEIGTALAAADKATRDYADLLEEVPEAERRETTFVFVTPLSGRRAWQHTWKPDAQREWLDRRRRHGHWKDVRLIDGTNLVDWLADFPSVDLWLADRILGTSMARVETPDQRWKIVRSIGEPPPLVPQLFVANRNEALERVASVFDGDTLQAKLDTRYPDQVVDFVCAYIADLDSERRAEVVGRSVIVSGRDAWISLLAVRERMVLIADVALDLTGESGTNLIQRARSAGHAVIFGGPPGGVPDPSSVALRSPAIQQVEDALRTAGYSEQRAKSLSQRSGGNLGSLLRCVQNLSVLPAWAEGSAAAELTIAALLGSWNEDGEGDRAAVERLVGNSYGEWIGHVRELALRPDTPLIHQENRWRFVPRFEGWYALGPRVFDEHLDRLLEVALTVLGESDPQFDLAKDERYAAGIYGKVLAHSRRLRAGVADALALLGSHTRALTSCSIGKAAATAALAVRKLLDSPDWTRWGALNDVLPLLAEASPEVFLDCVRRMVRDAPNVVDALFEQEGGPVTGQSYLTGMLWALETLAWDPAYFARAVSTLGELAARDPGGSWSNRPGNSLREIFLPWLPQTCASASQRFATVTVLVDEQSAVGWKLLLALLPELHGVSMPTRRPAWRPSIPDDWTFKVTDAAYWTQITGYANLAVETAKQNVDLLPELVRRWSSLTPEAGDKLYAYLESIPGTNFPLDLRQRIWAALSQLVAEHQRFRDADWAMEIASVRRLAILADRLVPSAPSARHQPLFSERAFVLPGEEDNYAEEERRLEQKRQKAVAEIMRDGGVDALVAFAQTVDAPWRVGSSLGQVGLLPLDAGEFANLLADPSIGGALPNKRGPLGREVVSDPGSSDWVIGSDPDASIDTSVLPALLGAETTAVVQFAGSFVRGRFHRYGWRWVDALDMDDWSRTERGQLLAFLPFVPETWDRAEKLIDTDAAEYWLRVVANPFETRTGLVRAVTAFLHHRRPQAAVACLARLTHDGQTPSPDLVVKALLALVPLSKDLAAAFPSFEVVQLIKALQADPAVAPGSLLQVEWAYLPLLDGHHGATPETLMRRLASEPGFFCELIRQSFRSQTDDTPTRQLSSDAASRSESATDALEMDKANTAVRGAPQADTALPVAENAYRLLRMWSVPPGALADNGFDGEQLVTWLEGMRQQAAMSGHLEIGLTFVGQVLFYSPKDPGGLWIHRAVATVLNASDADDLRDGFLMQTMNSRGMHWVDPSGKAEDALSRTYKEQADDLDTAGYSRLAATMRAIAANYERQADHVRLRQSEEV